MEKENNKEKILTLCPQVNNNEINDKYADMLDVLLKDDDCHNIALLGPYGSGKSSIIKTYFSNRKSLKKKSLTISIGSYINDFKSEEETTNGVINDSEQGLVDEVEKSILKQIVYTNKQSKFPKSTLIRFDKISMGNKIFHFICLLFIILFVGYHIFKLYDIDITFKLLWRTFGVYGIVVLLILGYYLYRLVESVANEVKINKIKISDCEIEFRQDTDSLFSRYLTEIVYFFKCTNYSIVVFEDLDRFPDDVALKVIQELKELNTILNNADGISKLVFLYAINDNIFSKVEDKNKFYDYNLSVLPISTSFNAELNLIGLLKFKNVYSDISANLIAIVSKYVYDMRMLKNIVNDYCIFKKITNTENYDKLFAMVVYKNFYYKEYNKLGSIDDDLSDLLRSVEDKRKELTGKLLSKKEEKLQQIKEINEYHINNVDELKRLLLSYNQNYDYSYGAVSGYFLGSSNQIAISNFLSENFDFNQLKENTFELYRQGRISENTVFSNFGSKEQFLERCEKVFDNRDEKITKLKLEISTIEEEIRNISNSKAKDIFKKYYELFDVSDALKSELISCGFIETDYMDYVTAPVIYGEKGSEESLKYSDSQFLMNIRQNKYSFELKIIGFKTIIERVKDSFSSKYILNYDFVNYLMDGLDYEKYVYEILEQFRDCDIDMLKFLIEFLRRYQKYSNDIFNYFVKHKIDIWGQCSKNIEFMTSEDLKCLIKEILIHSDTLSFVSDLDSFKFYVEEFLTIDDLNELLGDSIFKKNLLIIKPRFKNICLLNKSKFSFLYLNNLYRFTKDNLSYIADCDVVDISMLYNTNKTRHLVDYLEDNLLLFCKEFYIGNEVKFNKLRLVKKTFDCCNDEIDIMKQLCVRESFELDSLLGIPKSLFNEILDYNHIMITWENIFGLFESISNKKLFAVVDKEITRLLKTKLYVTKCTNSFFEQYVLHLLRTNIKMCKKVVKYYNIKYSELNVFTDSELNFLVVNNCVSFGKIAYRIISKKCNLDDKNRYVLNFYKGMELTVFLNTIACEDVMNLCMSINLVNSEKLELLYGLYKKEKRNDSKKAYSNFVERFKYVYSVGISYSFECRDAIYSNVLIQMKKDGLFDFASINNKIIFFKLK